MQKKDGYIFVQDLAGFNQCGGKNENKYVLFSAHLLQEYLKCLADNRPFNLQESPSIEGITLYDNIQGAESTGRVSNRRADQEMVDLCQGFTLGEIYTVCHEYIWYTVYDYNRGHNSVFPILGKYFQEIEFSEDYPTVEPKYEMTLSEGVFLQCIIQKGRLRIFGSRRNWTEKEEIPEIFQYFNRQSIPFKFI